MATGTPRRTSRCFSPAVARALCAPAAACSHRRRRRSAIFTFRCSTAWASRSIRSATARVRCRDSLKFAMRTLHASAAAILLSTAALAADSSAEFATSIRAVLVENCGACHNAAKARGPANFLKAQNAADIEFDRGLWRNVAAQLRNRTMPPVASKLTEEDRLRAAAWIDNRLRVTACSAGPFAGAPAIRRLNRREYHNTIRDLLGVDFDAVQVFPADGTGGAGFDTNGETLYTPPMMMERYLQAAQEILDRAIVTPPLARVFSPIGGAIPGGDGYSFALPVYADDEYVVQVGLIPKDPGLKLTLAVDG